MPHGETPDVVRNHPLLKGMTIPRTGQPASVGLVITKTLVSLGESQLRRLGSPARSVLRAYDKTTGKEVGAVFMPAPQSGSPMTYMARGRQFTIVVAVSGGPTQVSTRVSAAERRSCLEFVRIMPERTPSRRAAARKPQIIGVLPAKPAY